MKKINKTFLLINLIIINLLIMLLPLSLIEAKTSEGWGFSKNDQHLTPEIGRYQTIIEGTNSIYVGDKKQKVVYLTFDAGYDNGVLVKILNTLRNKQVKATFFVTGDFVNRFPELTLQLVYDGHIIGNHSYTHRRITSLTKDELKNDLLKLEHSFYNLTKCQLTKFFRPPEGVFNKESLMNLKELGYKTVFWSIAYRDWQENRQLSKDECVNIIKNNLHPGAIILLHTVSKTNEESLEVIIDMIYQEGYEIGSLDKIKFTQNN